MSQERGNDWRIHHSGAVEIGFAMRSQFLDSVAKDDPKGNELRHQLVLDNTILDA